MGWEVHRLTMMQWSNLTKCGLFSTYTRIVPPAVHTLLPSVLQSLDSRGIEALILILEKSSIAYYDLSSVRYCFPVKWGFFVLGTENSQMVPNQEDWELEQPVQSHSHAQQPLQPQTVCRSIVLVKQDSLRQFFRPFTKCPAGLLSKSPYPVWVYLEGNNAVIIRKDCQIWLLVAPLLHSQLPVWSFHPSFVYTVTAPIFVYTHL